MTRTEAESHLIGWNQHYWRVYRFVKPFVPVEYLTLSKSVHSGSYTCIASHSTKDIGIMSENEMINRLMQAELIYYTECSWPMDVQKLKTGGCTCGAWATSDPSEHSPHTCDLMKNLLPIGGKDGK